MHKTPKPISTPAAVGAIQWIESVNPVQPNLCNIKIQLAQIGIKKTKLLKIACTHQKIPAVKTGAPIIAGDKRHSGIETFLLETSFFIYVEC